MTATPLLRAVFTAKSVNTYILAFSSLGASASRLIKCVNSTANARMSMFATKACRHATDFFGSNKDDFVGK